jgi:hypothetical protein
MGGILIYSESRMAMTHSFGPAVSGAALVIWIACIIHE